jgi:molybdopterin/thiamine biosynthesis adenylyltransferase
MPLDEYPGPQSPVPSGDSRDAHSIPDSERYSRQILFPGIGETGQRSLARSHVAIAGCGATGAAAASLLARAGVGTLTLIDRDFVEPSNLQRQVLFDEADARDSLPKAEAARRHIAQFNSAITVQARIADIVPANITGLLPADSIDIILDATDNFETRYLLNDYAVQQSIPWIYAAAIGAYAATMNILPRRSQPLTDKLQGAPSMTQPHRGMGGIAFSPTACLACLFPKPPTGNTDTCDTAGILSTAVNLAASIQVTEALKYLTGQPQLMRRTLLSCDLWRNERSEITASTPRPDCEVCGTRVFSHLAGQSRPHITLCGRDSVQIHEHRRPVDLAALRTRLQSHSDIEDLRSNDLLLRFRRGTHTLTVFPDGRALIQGTMDITLARSLYARFIGA